MARTTATPRNPIARRLTAGTRQDARQRWEPVAQVTPGEELCWVVLDGVRSSGNLGSVIRSCEAVGAAGLILLGDTADPFDPVTVRATMGAIFSRRFVRATPRQLTRWAARHGVMLVGAASGATLDYRAVSYQRPVALLLGGERRGLPPHLLSKCHATVRIPMSGPTDSLNLAVATGVLLYEVFGGSGGPYARP